MKHKRTKKQLGIKSKKLEKRKRLSTLKFLKSTVLCTFSFTFVTSEGLYTQYHDLKDQILKSMGIPNSLVNPELRK